MSGRRRILIVGDYGHMQGGAEISMLQLKDGLRGRGHEVLMVTSSAGLRSTPGDLHLTDKSVFGTTSRLRGPLQAYNPVAKRQMRVIVKEFRPDLVHLNMFLTQLSPDVLDAFAGVPVLHFVHWYRLVCMTGLKMLPDGSSCPHPAGRACLNEKCVSSPDWLFLVWQLRRLQQRRKAIVTMATASETVRARLEAEGVQVDFVIPYGTEAVGPRPVLHDPPRVGFAGRLVPAKGGETLVRAFALVLAKLPCCRLDIYGSGPQEGDLKKLCRSLGISDRVLFHGWVNKNDLSRLLAPCWVQAAVSTFEEPFGMVAVEAAMRGTAVVASNHGGYRETVVDGVTGILVPPQDAGVTARALLSVLSDRQYAERLGRAGREHALAHFEVRQFTDRQLEAIEETIRRYAVSSSRPGVV